MAIAKAGWHEIGDKRREKISFNGLSDHLSIFDFSYGSTNAATITISPDPIEVAPFLLSEQITISLDELAVVNTTVNLSGPTLDFFSDPTGINQIINVTVLSGLDMATFYLTRNATGTATLTASAAGYVSGTADVLSPVPLPAALPLFLSGLAVFGFVARKRRKAAA